MKTFLVSIALLFPFIAQASEFVTLSRANRSVSVQPSDIVTVVSAVGSGETNYCEFTFANDPGGVGTKPYFRINAGEGIVVASNLTFTGLTAVSLRDNGYNTTTYVMVTLRITKTADQIASQPVVLPAVTDGVYSVTIETSTDLENWAPAAPGDYLGDTSHRFFRVKAERKPASNP